MADTPYMVTFIQNLPTILTLTEQAIPWAIAALSN